METQLQRIAKVAKTKPKEKFTSLIHLVNKETLTACHSKMKGNKASGIDDMTKAAYEQNLEGNIEELLNKMRRQAYKPQPARRVYIPKPGTDKQRPLGIPAYEDKLVQTVIAKILNAIYEQDFVECSFGFRPKRSCHDALKLLDKIVNKSDINYVVDTDIKGFFDNVDHEWMMKFLEHRIADKNLLRVLSRMLKAGIVCEGNKYATPLGTPQGGVISPILANIYLHYVIDIWFDKIVRKRCLGSAFMVRYADDIIFTFQYEEDAKQFYKELIPRLSKFNLELAKEKTKFIKLNKKNVADKEEDDKWGKSFDFLGFTHYVGKDSNGQKRVKRKTSKKSLKASILRCKEWMKANRIIPVEHFMKIMQSKIRGHCNYYGVTDNRKSVGNFIDKCRSFILSGSIVGVRRKASTIVNSHCFLKHIHYREQERM